MPAKVYNADVLTVKKNYYYIIASYNTGLKSYHENFSKEAIPKQTLGSPKSSTQSAA